MVASRKHRVVAIAVLAVLTAGSGGLIRGCAAADRSASATAVASALPVGTLAADSDPTPAAQSRSVRPVAPTKVLPGVRYTFDAEADGALPDVGGTLPLRIRESGGSVSTVAGRSGQALRFPEVCHQGDESACPRAILESGPAAFLNPGGQPIRFGASVLMRPDQTSKGANVLQKGYSVNASEYKLQVDGEAGRPSCVLVGTGSPQIHLAVAPLTVADGRWHTIDCIRISGFLAIAVDSVERGRVAVPDRLSVTNDHPLRIGGKGLSPNNDQFHGAIDDAYVLVGAA
jgi:hypothetical protein